MIHSFFASAIEQPDEEESFIQVMENTIRIFTRKKAKKYKLRFAFEGLNIRQVVDIDQQYLYTIDDTNDGRVFLSDTEADDDTKVKLKDLEYSGPGFYVYDIERLLDGQIEKYKIASSIGGVNYHIDKSTFSNRFAFLRNYSQITVVPFPHLNSLKCQGMSQMHDYLIWREKNGFFTALDKRGKLITWSLLTGKLLYKEAQIGDADASSDKMDKYEVFRSDNDDITYTRDYFNLADRSITLLQSKESLEKQLETL